MWSFWSAGDETMRQPLVAIGEIRVKTPEPVSVDPGAGLR